jgi:hypothetical protein
MKTKIFILLMLVVIGASACTDTAERASVLEVSSCELPCWLGISVGSTTIEEAELKLLEHPNVIQGSIINLDKEYKIYDSELRFTLFEGWENKNHVGVNLYVKQGIVSRISISGDLGVSFEQIINTTGSPEYVFADWNMRGDVNVNIVFPIKGIHMVVILEDEKTELGGEDNIQTLVVFDPSDYSELLALGFFHDGLYDSEETSYYVWSGYGLIEEKYWPPQK